MTRLTRAALFFVLSLGLLVSNAAAFPTRPVTIVVPYAVGGSTDVLARVLAERMSRELGQPMIVDNTGGAGGTIGTSKVVRAARDGHTILFHNVGLATAPALYKLHFDPAKDLVPIGEAGEVPMILVGSRHFRPDTLEQVMAHAKANPSEVKFSNAGIGSSSHLCSILLAQAMSAKVTVVPYKGTGPALQDLVAGSVDLICDQPVSTGPNIQAGNLKPYAVATRERLAILPNVPTFTEAGLPGVELSVWHGFYAPTGTPRAAIDRLNEALRATFLDPAVAQRLTAMGVIIPADDALEPQALGTRTTREIERWSGVISAAGIKAQ